MAVYQGHTHLFLFFYVVFKYALRLWVFFITFRAVITQSIMTADIEYTTIGSIYLNPLIFICAKSNMRIIDG